MVDGLIDIEMIGRVLQDSFGVWYIRSVGLYSILLHALICIVVVAVEVAGTIIDFLPWLNKISALIIYLQGLIVAMAFIIGSPPPQKKEPSSYYYYIA